MHLNYKTVRMSQEKNILELAETMFKLCHFLTTAKIQIQLPINILCPSFF